MSFVSIIELSYQAGSKLLFSGLSLTINVGDKIGLVGHNGCGKSTLLKLIDQSIEPDNGRINIQRGLKVGVVEQFVPDELLATTCFNAVLNCLPENEKSSSAYKVEALLSQLGFDLSDQVKPLSEFSGGQQNLLLFARASILEPEMLLLDEPGNHMDSVAMYYLTTFLSSNQAPAFMMISHDRELLDTVTDKTIFLRDETCYSFNSPYSKAKIALSEQDEASAQMRDAEEQAILKLQKSAKRLAIWGREHDNEKLARKAKSMEKRIERLEEEKTFVSQGSGLSLNVNADLLRSKQLVAFDDLTVKTPNGRVLFYVEELYFKPGDRIALLGHNGTGKSTCIEALMASYKLPVDQQNDIRFNPNVNIGYFDQKLAQFDIETSLIDWCRNQSTSSEEDIKRGLIQWGFPYADHSRKVNVLSGGEKARLLLLTFQLDQPNVLIMDEPTNHIDLQGKEELEENIINNGVSLLFTSHDSQFIRNVATRFWWIHNERLLEIIDPKEYFDSIRQMAETNTSVEEPASETTVVISDSEHTEEELLVRICWLEEKLTEDKERKLKFQKLNLQKQWEQELQVLLDKLS